MNAVCNAVTNGVCNGVCSLVPTRPDPVKSLRHLLKTDFGYFFLFPLRKSQGHSNDGKPE